ncbi:MAG: hypothetical protein ACR2ID_09305 [Chthoniobacterales bacterium]
MHKLLLMLLASAALFVTGCADFGEPDENEHGPAPYSPDPTSHLPPPTNDRISSPRI